MPELEVITLRAGSRVAPLRVLQEGDVLHLCSGMRCPHYVGQLALPGMQPRERDFICALAGFPPSKICQPLYQEGAEELDKTRRDGWTLEEAEKEERRREGLAS